MSEETKADLAEATDETSRQALISALTADGVIPNESQLMLSGYLTVQNGRFLNTTIIEETQPALDAPSSNEFVAPNDQVVADDFIVDGSLCVGMDCVNGESFGFDTLRLKENNLRIRAFDTSNSGSFPSNDWQITFNDSTNGGANKFSIDDIDGGKTPFTIEAGAPSHSLYVDDGGRIGLGTSTPVVEIQVKDGDTPTLRLEQDGSSGFSAQTWDVAGNEAGFFVRDVSNGGTLPFRILPGAASESLVIDGNEDVGIGAGTNPQAPLHIKRSNGTANIIVEETNSTVAARSILTLRNNGAAQISFEDNDEEAVWTMGMGSGNRFLVNLVGSGGSELIITSSGTVRFSAQGNETLFIDSSGNVTAAGTINGSSSRALKENLVGTNGSILNRVMNLPIYYYNYIADGSSIQHVGPMSEDFAALFEVGADNKHISPMDMAGVAIAAIQELHEKMEAKEAEINGMQLELIEQQAQIAELEAQNADLEARLAALEAIVLEQMAENK